MLYKISLAMLCGCSAVGMLLVMDFAAHAVWSFAVVGTALATVFAAHAVWILLLVALKNEARFIYVRKLYSFWKQSKKHK